MDYEAITSTRQGDRTTNQDRCLIMSKPDSVLLALADGMGGHPCGETAAQILMDTARERFYGKYDQVAQPRSFLNEILQTAHQEIGRFGAEQEPPIEPRTTAVLCLLQEDMAYWAHVGDSRFYLLREGEIHRRTFDHSYVEQLQQQGVIDQQQAQYHQMRNYVTRCLGGFNNQPEPDFDGPVTLHVNDYLLLCSDGYWSALPEKDMVNSFFSSDRTLSTHLSQLTREAVSISHPRSDNVTALCLRVKMLTTSLEPADISMALTDNAALSGKEKKSANEIQQAIDELRRLVENDGQEE